jgi:hypothetical protein
MSNFPLACAAWVMEVKGMLLCLRPLLQSRCNCGTTNSFHCSDKITSHSQIVARQAVPLFCLHAITQFDSWMKVVLKIKAGFISGVLRMSPTQVPVLTQQQFLFFFIDLHPVLHFPQWPFLTPSEFLLPTGPSLSVCCM